MSLSRHFHSMPEFLHFTLRIAENVDRPFVIAAAMASHVMHARARDIFGDVTKLAPLAQATRDERVRLGYSANEPLLRDGRLLRRSVERFHAGMVGAIGSSEVIMAYHEFGYINARTGAPVPPRPVFQRALEESEAEVHRLADEAVGAALGGVTFGTSLGASRISNLGALTP